MDTFDTPGHLAGAIEFAMGRTPGIKRELTPEMQKRLAEKIVEHLQLSNWRFSKGPPSRSVGQIIGRSG